MLIPDMRGKSKANLIALFHEWLAINFSPSTMPDAMTVRLMFAAWEGCYEKITSIPKQHREELLMWIDESQQ